MLKLASWNVNGIRACANNGFFDWLKRANFDVVLLQEVRALEEQLPKEMVNLKRYEKVWFPATSKKGYSGVGILSKLPIEESLFGMETEEFDVEGRVLACVLKDVVVVSAYFPNSQDKGKRIDYKVGFCRAIHQYVNQLRKQYKRPVVLSGDYNIAHHEIDLARPDTNHGSPGFLPAEREWMDEFVDSGWVDTFRSLHPKAKERYSWWSARTRARERNVGWRIDYNCIHQDDMKFVKAADIKEDVMGSDHCPVSLTLV